jgi:hypothetical protein
MKQCEAQGVYAYVRSRYGDKILCAIDDSHAHQDGNGYSIVLLLLAGQRKIVSPFVESIKSILLCWEATFLQPARPRQPIGIIEEQLVVDRHTPENGYECGNPRCICHRQGKRS